MNSIFFNETYLTLAQGLLEIELEASELNSSFLWTTSKRLILNNLFIIEKLKWRMKSLNATVQS